MLQKLIQLIVFSVFVLVFSCTAQKKVVTDEDFITDASESLSTSSDDFSDGELSLDDKPATADVSKNTPDQETDELSLEKELESVTVDDVGTASAGLSQPVAEPEVLTELTLEPEPAQAATVAVTPKQTDVIPAPIIENPAPVTMSPPEIANSPAIPLPEVVAPVNESVKKPLVQIKDIQFKSNDSGGAFMINADAPLEYTTRLNSSTNQIIIEVQNVQVPNRFKRPLNTKDMTSSIGYIDVYQKQNSTTARFVIQLRPNSDQPLIQPEGTSLMVIGSAQTPIVVKTKSTDTTEPQANQASGGQQVLNQTNNDNSNYKIKGDPSENVEINTDLSSESIMNTVGMDDYLANNTKFHGRKISIETTDVNVRDVLKFISEESGVNMIFDDSIVGNITLKLRKVPWDQALVLILKSKGLSYRRQGTVLRIAANETLVREEKAAIELKNSKTEAESLVVKNFSINYAEIGELETKLKDFIASNDAGTKTKGRITSDKRTNTMIVTETPTKLKQVEALIKALDTQPQQVMIEARVIEASEAFTKSVGTNWGLNRPGVLGSDRINTNIGQPWSDPQPIQFSPQIDYSSKQSASGSFGASLWLGKLGVLGNLDVQLKLEESEDKIKILSSPRVTVLTNTQASINQLFKLPVGTATTTNNGVSIAETKFADVGVKLSVTPQISNLGTVRMSINVERTGLQPGGTTNSRDMKTEVIVKSGETSVIGGVFQSDTSLTKNGVPGLKDIPILGTLFRGQNSSNSKTELMVFVTPKILAPVVPNFNSAAAPVETPDVLTK